MKRLFNISNHPSSTWTDEQKAEWDVIIDVPFPKILPFEDAKNVQRFADDFIHFWVEVCPEVIEPGDYIYVAGDYCFTYYLMKSISETYPNAIFTWPSTERQVVESIQDDGSTKKTSIFKFVRWR